MVQEQWTNALKVLKKTLKVHSILVKEQWSSLLEVKKSPSSFDFQSFSYSENNMKDCQRVSYSSRTIN